MILDEKDAEIEEMQRDIEKLTAFKGELEAIVEDQQLALQGDGFEKAKRLKELERELNHSRAVAEDAAFELKELKTKYTVVQNKLSKLKGGKIVELQRRNKDLTNQNEILKDMLGSMKKDLSTKDINLRQQNTRIHKLEKILR